MRHRVFTSCAALAFAASVAYAQSGDIAAPFGGAEFAAAEDFVATRSRPSAFDTSRLVAQVRVQRRGEPGDPGYDVNVDGDADISADADAVAAAKSRAGADAGADVGLAPTAKAAPRDLDDAVLANLDASTPVDEGQIKVTTRRDGTVVLNGTVDSEAQKKLVEAVVASTPAVTAVRSRIVVRDLPGGPEELVPAAESRNN